MYIDEGPIDEKTLNAIRSVLPEQKWQYCRREEGETHMMGGCKDAVIDIPGLVERWAAELWEQAIFLRLLPRDHPFRHSATKSGIRYHIPVETNDQAVSVTYPHGDKIEQHLEVGRVYSIDPEIEHESFNEGMTDRTHLIVITFLRENKP
jgi:hypothetical protein